MISTLRIFTCSYNARLWCCGN
uniref:Uncharacterized protein n=1 Tax=Arundo donax TaxID=35708 RepID=A0A0A9E9K2_ARUDO